MPKEYSLSAVVLSCNSAKKIAACLDSLKGWADEIIIVDGNSSDNTRQIAESRGVSFYAHSFLGAFSEERNFGAEKAKGEWILQLDSDEVLAPEFKDLCDKTLPGTEYRAFKFKRKNFFLGHPMLYGGWYHWSQHLYRRGFARYEGRVHEKMVVDGKIGLIEADVLHYPFDSISEFIDRQNRYTDLQAQDIIDTEKGPDLKKIRYNLTWRPLKLFKKIYWDKKAHKDGMYGLVFSLLFSFVHILKWVKVWEKVSVKYRNPHC